MQWKRISLAPSPVFKFGQFHSNTLKIKNKSSNKRKVPLRLKKASFWKFGKKLKKFSELWKKNRPKRRIEKQFVSFSWQTWICWDPATKRKVAAAAVAKAHENNWWSPSYKSPPVSFPTSLLKVQLEYGHCGHLRFRNKASSVYFG